MEFLATWEEIYNPDFKVFESEHFKKEAGLVTFTPSVSEWDAKRFLSKNNYLIQTDAVITVLSNLESHNAQMIRDGKEKTERFMALKEIAEYQLRVLGEAERIGIESDDN